MSCADLSVPTRQGVHWPQLSCAKNRITFSAASRALSCWLKHHDSGRADEAAVALQGVKVQEAHRPDVRARCRHWHRRANRRRAYAPRPCRRSIHPPIRASVMPAGASLTPGCFHAAAHTESTQALAAMPSLRCKAVCALLDAVRAPKTGSQNCVPASGGQTADLGYVGRAHARLTAFAFDAFDHGRLFAADVSARATAQFDARQGARRVGSFKCGQFLGQQDTRFVVLVTQIDVHRLAMPTTLAAISTPSRKRCGSASRQVRSLKVPGSPSSMFTAINAGPGWLRTMRHLRPAGKPAPPKPRRPEDSKTLHDRFVVFFRPAANCSASW